MRSYFSGVLLLLFVLSCVLYSRGVNCFFKNISASGQKGYIKMAITFTSAIPERIDAEHYTMQSETKKRTYNLEYDRLTRRWGCDCPDVKHNKNINCKHVRRLREWIKEQRELQNGASPAEAQAIAVSEVAQESQISTELAALRERLEELESAANYQAIQAEKASKKIDALLAELAQERELRQQQVAALLDAVVKRQSEIKDLAASQLLQIGELEKLRSERKLEIEISVRQPGSRKAASPRTAKAKAPTPAPALNIAPPKIEQVREGLHLINGSRVFGSVFATACECEEAQAGITCEHMTALNLFLGMK